LQELYPRVSPPSFRYWRAARGTPGKHPQFEVLSRFDENIGKSGKLGKLESLAIACKTVFWYNKNRKNVEIKNKINPPKFFFEKLRWTKNMPQKTKTKKTIAKKTKTKNNPTPMNLRRKDMRFKISLVILIGMLTFSSLLLLLSLNKSSATTLDSEAAITSPAKNISGIKKSGSKELNDNTLDFKLTVPVQLGEWLYKTGEVKSLTDDFISNQYLRIFIPLSGAKSNNFDDQNKNILTIRRFSADEWSDVEKDCEGDKKDICGAAGTLIAQSDEWAYAYTKPTDCLKSIAAKCDLAGKIIESFTLK